MSDTQKQLIVRTLNTVEGEVPVWQRPGDGYINATQICQAAGKFYADWRKQDRAQDYLEELARSMSIRIDQLIDVVSKGPNTKRGTWVHPRIALRIAQWCSPQFEVQVDTWLEAWLTGKGRDISGLLRMCFYDDATPWEKRVPNQFWVQLKRLYGVKYDPAKGSPEGAYPAKLVKHLIISRLPKFVQEGLEEFNPVGDNNKRKYKHHQWLKDGTARTHYEYIVQQCVRVMTESKTRGGFEQLWDILFPEQEATQISLLPPNYLLGN